MVRAESSSDCPNGVVPCVLRGGQHGIVRHQEEHHCSNRQQRLKPERAPALQSLAARSPGPGRPGKLWPRWGPGAPAAKDPGDCRDAASVERTGNPGGDGGEEGIRIWRQIMSHVQLHLTSTPPSMSILA